MASTAAASLAPLRVSQGPRMLSAPSQMISLALPSSAFIHCLDLHTSTGNFRLSLASHNSPKSDSTVNHFISAVFLLFCNLLSAASYCFQKKKKTISFIFLWAQTSWQSASGAHSHSKSTTHSLCRNSGTNNAFPELPKSIKSESQYQEDVHHLFKFIYI